MKTIIMTGIVDFIVAICSAAVIGGFAYIFRDKFFNYIADAKLMKRIGIKRLRKNSHFSSAELYHIFTNASVIKIYYKTGERFWKRLEEEKILQAVQKKNPKLKVKVLLANKDSKQSRTIFEAERYYKTRDSSENNIIKEIDTVSKLLSKYPFIEYKTDPDLFFLPYMIVKYAKKKKCICYLGLNIIPIRSPNSLQIVSEKKISDDDWDFFPNPNYIDKDFENNATLAEQLIIHFSAAWKLAISSEERNIQDRQTQ